jgi:thiamine-monophosphate kinase
MAEKPNARKRALRSAVIQPASEDSLVQRFKSRYTLKGTQIETGIGDDAAVIRPNGVQEFWLITTDMLVESVDFSRRWTTPQQLGRKSIAVNLSDLAAMGASPRFFTVSLAIPSSIPESWILHFHDGLVERGRSFGAFLIGGDLSREEKHIVISITALGESRNRKILYRSGGKAGDLLYVTGNLGRSAAGLKLLQNPAPQGTRKLRKEALQAQLDPEPRCDVGLWLAQSGLVSCMMDLSDGLSMDLPRLCAASNVGAEIRVQSLPVFPESAMWNLNPVALALHGGEDYELLFAVPRSKSRMLEEIYPATFPPITRIGEMNPDKGKVWLVDQESGQGRRLLPKRGWDHFRNRKTDRVK